MHRIVRHSTRFGLLLGLLLEGSGAALAQDFVALSRASNGAFGDLDSSSASASADGRWIAFNSAARNLVAPEADLDADVFLADTWDGGLRWVSRTPSGQGGAGDSFRPKLSDDGEFVGFTSLASNLVSNMTGSLPQAMVCDLATGAIELASVNVAGVQGAGASDWVDVSNGGRFVVFCSGAADLIAGDTNLREDVFVRDRQLGQTTRVSLNFAAQQATWPSGSFSAPTVLHSSITPDGRFVAFATIFALAANDTNAAMDVYVFDRVTSVLERVSLSSAGAEGDALSHYADLSADGRFVTFASDATNLVAGDVNGDTDYFLRDRGLGTTLCVSRTSAGVPAGVALGGLGFPRISPDGTHVAFSSSSALIALPDVNPSSDVFLYERSSGLIERVLAAGAAPNGSVAEPALSNGAATVAFTCGASNFVAGDTNGRFDVIAWRRARCTPLAYCTAGTSANGCVPQLSASGAASLSNCTLSLALNGVDGQRQGLIFYGVSGAQALPWGTSSSLFCVKSPTQRTPLQATGGTAGSCNGQIALDWCSHLASQPGALGVPFSEGDAVYAQAWYRDPAGPKTTAFSNAVRFEYCP